MVGPRHRHMSLILSQIIRRTKNVYEGLKIKLSQFWKREPEGERGLWLGEEIFDQAEHQGPTTHCQVDFHQMPMLMSHDPPLLHAGIARGLAILPGPVKHQPPPPQIQLSLGAHIEKITPKSKDITPSEAIVDMDISVEADTFCDNVYSNIEFDALSVSSSDSLNQYDAQVMLKTGSLKMLNFGRKLGLVLGF